MSDDYNNGNIDPEYTDNVDSNTDQNNTTGGGTPANEPKKEETHTSIPGGTQNQNIYNGYQYQNGQYRIVYNRGQGGTNTNPYGTQNYGQGQNTNPYGQNQNGYYNGNSGYGGYQNGQPHQQPYQQYQQPYRQPPVNQPPVNQPPKKSSGGKIVAIIAICAAIAIIFSACGAIAGWMLRKSNTSTNEPAVSGRTETEPEHTSPFETEPRQDETEPDTAEESQTAPLTDPDAKIQTSASGQALPMTEAAAKTVDSVVEISTEQTVQGSFMQQYVVQGGGSGIIITEDGYITTNNHVIADATQIKVTLRNGQTYNATLVGTDATSDLAVIKIDAKDLKPATFGDSSKLVVAESVFAIGNPLGELGGTVTQGIISALERTITIDNQEMTLLQTTAAINPGNSGGGLFNLAGECVGVVNAKSSGSGIEGLAFAIPSNSAVKVIQDLMQYGFVRGRVMLGITMLDVTDQYTLYRYNLKDYGVYISKITSGSDAEKAGLKSADRLITIDGVKINSSATARKQIQNHSVGDKITVVVSRDGTEMTFEITLTEYIPVNHSLS